MVGVMIAAVRNRASPIRIGFGGNSYRDHVGRGQRVGDHHHPNVPLIENYAGRFPLWLAPTQVMVIPVSEKYVEYAARLKERLLDASLRVDANMRSDRVGYKIRDASLKKIPYALVVGEKEEAAQSVNVRSRDRGELGEMTVEQFLRTIETEREPGGERPEPAEATGSKGEG
jgi:hypothetical protein